MRTSAGEIKYVYKGELLSAEEFIKAQDEKIQELKNIIEEKDEAIRKLRSQIQRRKNEKEIVIYLITKHKRCQKDIENP